MPSPQHDEVVAALRAFAAEQPAGVPTFEQARARLDAFGDVLPVPDGVEVEPVEQAGVRCERYRAVTGAETDALVLYLHGGSYTAGSLRSHRSPCARLALAAGVAVLAVDYRLAPEHPHPAGLHDVLAVYRSLLADGHDPGRLVSAGDSAGAGLTVATLLALAGSGEPRPAGAVLISPWLDLTLSGDSITSAADADVMLDAASLAHSATAYGGAEPDRPLVSPVHAPAEQLATLPPLLVLAGTADILVDDSRLFAERAGASGATVELDVENDLMHVWPLLGGVPEADRAMDRIGSWIRDRLGLPPTGSC